VLSRCVLEHVLKVRLTSRTSSFHLPKIGKCVGFLKGDARRVHYPKSWIDFELHPITNLKMEFNKLLYYMLSLSLNYIFFKGFQPS
jgi:hypothetical protein